MSISMKKLHPLSAMSHGNVACRYYFKVSCRVADGPSLICVESIKVTAYDRFFITENKPFQNMFSRPALTSPNFHCFYFHVFRISNNSLIQNVLMRFLPCLATTA